MPPEDDYQVIGWLFTARDEASAVATRAQDVITTVTGNMAAGVAKIPDVLQTVTGAAVAVLESDWAAKVGSAFLKPIELAEDTIGAVFKGLFTTPIKAVTLLTKGMVALGTAGARAGVQFGSFVRGMVTVENITKTFGRDGLLGVLLGPLAPLLRLLSPIIDMLVEGLMPAVETFTAIIKTAFNPLFELAELLAQALAPMVQEFIAPFAELMEVIAVQAAGFIVSLLKGDSASSGIASLFQSLGPVIMDIFKALGGLAADLLPIVVTTFKKLAPIAIEVVKIIAKFAADLLPQLGEVAKKVLPPLAEAFVSLLKALLPLLPPLTKLAVTLVEKVFGPAVIKGAEWLAKWITKSFVPFVDEWMPALIIVIDDVTKKVADFYGNFGKYTKQFYVLFIKPMVAWVGELWDSIVNFFKGLPEAAAKAFEWLGEQVQAIFESIGLGGVGTKVSGFFEGVAGVIRAPIESIKTALNDYVIATFNKLISADLPLIGPLKDVEVLRELGLAEIPRLAAGGIAPPTPGGREVIVAEGGRPEAVVPLTPQSVKAFVEPVVAGTEIEVPGFTEALGLLADIRGILRGTLKVDAGDADGADEEFGDFTRAIGLSGVIG